MSATEEGGVGTLMPANPSAVAREALKQLASLRLPPTPENYARVYNHIADPGVRPAPGGALAMLRELTDDLQRAVDDPIEEAAALRRALDRGDWLQAKTVLRTICTRKGSGADDVAWGPLIRDLLQWWEARTPAFTQARKREILDHVLTAFSYSAEALFNRLGNVTRMVRDQEAEARPDEPAHAADTPTASVATLPAEAAAATVASPAPLPVAAAAADATRAWAEVLGARCRELLAEAIVVVSDEYPEELTARAQELAAEARAATDPARLDAMARKLREFWNVLARESREQRDIQEGLLRLLQLLTENVGDLIGDASWLRGQLKALKALSTGPVTLDKIAGLERSLREIAKRQGALKASLDQAKDAMKQMVATFIERVGELVTNTGEYHDRLAGYAVEIEGATDIAELSQVILHVMEDTRGIQVDLGKSREELMEARRTVEQFQERAARLESELVLLSDRLQEDQLTQVLNRRGLDRAFESETARADRYHRPLSLAMLDVDNFKALNDRLGHQTGDAALVHLTASIRQSLRTTDVIARYGGEEFVILLPETALDDAMVVMTRVQRELTRRFFLTNNERVLITFSAGVTERLPGETQDEVIARADRALYEAKIAGKNRVAPA